MEKILVVDDEVHVRELVADALRQQGYAVVTVPSTEQALAVVFREPLSLIVLDLDVGGDCGISVLQRIRARNAGIPVVIYSGQATPERGQSAEIAGANAVLYKHNGLAPLLSAIRRLTAPEKRLAPPQAEKREATIMVVDDDGDIRRMLRDFLTDKGFLILEAENGAAALELARTSSVTAVLLDIQMPVMDGLTTLKKLREHYPDLGVIMVTGEQDDEKVTTAIGLGATGYILKPFDFLYLETEVMAKLSVAGAGGH